MSSKKQTTKVLHVVNSNICESRYREILQEQGFARHNQQYAFWKYIKPGCCVIFYESGKLVIQGRDSEKTYIQLLEANTYNALFN